MDYAKIKTLVGTRILHDSREGDFEIRYFRTEKAAEKIIYGLEMEKYSSISKNSPILESVAVDITDSSEQIDNILNKLIGNSVTVTHAPEVIDELFGES